MLTLPGSVRILLATQPVDMRNSIDGLMALVRTAWGEDVDSGHLFVFVSRKGDRVKILTFSRSGFVLYYKRLEAGRIRLATRPSSLVAFSPSAAPCWPLPGAPRSPPPHLLGGTSFL